MKTVLSLLGLAAKYAWRRRRKALLIGCVVALGNWVMIFQLAQGKGQERAFLDGMMRSLSGHLQIHSVSAGERSLFAASVEDTPPLPAIDELEALVRQDERVVATARRIRFGAMIAHEDESWGGFVVGVEPENERRVCNAVQVAEGRFVQAGENEIVISGQLAKERGVQIGQSLIILGSTVDGYFNAMEFRIVGLLSSSGLSRFYSSMVYIPIDRAKQLIGLESGEAYDLVLLLDDADQAPAVAAGLESRLAGRTETPVKIETWRDMGGLFLGILKVSQGFRWVMAFFLGSVIMILVFSTFSIYVFERSSEISTLLAVGYRKWNLVFLFVAEVSLIGLVASAVGLALGGGLSFWLGRVGIPAFNEALTYVFAGDRLFPIVRLSDVLTLLLGTWGVAMLAALIPALRAASVDPATALNRS